MLLGTSCALVEREREREREREAFMWHKGQETSENGYVIYQKWFDDGKMLKPKFMEIKSCHLITREQVTLLVSNAVQSKMYIYDD